MPTSQPANLTPATVFRMLRDHAWLWIATAIAGLVLTACVTLATPRKWKATQGMIVRSEAAGFAEQRLGKFTDLSEMRTAQETVLELARSRSVLEATLTDVGPAPSLLGSIGLGTSNWPTADDIESIRENLRITPPGGAEFGKTEVFYITILDTNADRAAELVDALANRLEGAMKNLRNTQAGSIVAELENATDAARTQLLHHTQRLAEMEQEVGADLADLRQLESSLSGQGVLGQQALAIENELRQNASSRRRDEKLLATLNSSLENPSRLLATPSALLTSQPALQRLKDGLVDARMQAASLQGTRSASHPFVVAAKEAETQLREQLHNEIPAALAGVKLELSLSQQREAALRGQLSEVRQRLSNLAGKRAEYSTLLAAVQNHTNLVDGAETQLAEARAHNAGAKAASVLARVDGVEAGIRPVGPGRAAVSLAGGIGGLILGLGIVFAFFAPEPTADVQPTVENEHATPGHWTELFPAHGETQTPVPGSGWTQYNVNAAGDPVCAV